MEFWFTTFTELPEKRTKRRYLFALCWAGICAAQTVSAPVSPAVAAPNTQNAASGVGVGRGGGGGGTVQYGSNEQEGVDIDRFIGYPTNKTVHISHGTLLTHSILRSGDPYVPGPQGAVLEYRKDLSTATLLPLSRTPLSTLSDAFFFYVKSGEGRLDDGKQFWDLKPNMAILAPPDVPHRFINTTDKPLEMIMLTFTGGPDAHKELIVRDVNLLPWCEENAHWNNESRCVFGTADGLLQGERIYLVMNQPWATSQPHSHGRGTEEIWVKVSPGTGVILLGSELRELPEDGAYLVPPTNTIDHSNINLSKTQVDWWIYIARGAAGGGSISASAAGSGAPANVNASAVSAGTPGGPVATVGGAGVAGRGGGGRGANPNISRDTLEATVAGKPLK
jgi:mannose-6-phosphate isomerase-like protein (cupin superfamily)